MFNAIYPLFEGFEDLLWGYLGAPAIVSLGVYLTIASRCFQLRSFKTIVKTFFGYLTSRQQKGKGIHPLKAFFACVGGCVGVGNIVGICTAIQIGGPGALFWIWITAILGSMVKYSEVYLGVRHRIVNENGEYRGGPMYFLQRLTPKAWLPTLFCVLLCIYGVEVFQFSVITESVATNFDIHRGIVTVVLLGLVIFAGSGGVQRVGNISSTLVPTFVFIYVAMGLWVLCSHYNAIPSVFWEVFTSAFTGSSATGGLIGSLIVTMSQGVRRGCYTGDLGVGYASVIHSESDAESPEKQASLVIFDIFLDSFIVCTMSVLIILVTGTWNQPLEGVMLVQASLEQCFPYMEYFIPIFLFLLGYSTINAYFCVGLKCAEFLSKKRGRLYFYIYGVLSLGLTAFVNTYQAQTIMGIAGGLLLIINSAAIFFLRNEVSYELEPKLQEQLA